MGEEIFEIPTVDPIRLKKGGKGDRFGYDKVVPTSSQARRSEPATVSKSEVVTEKQQRMEEKWRNMMIVFGIVTTMLILLIFLSVYYAIDARLQPALRVHSALEYLSIGGVCRAAYKNGEMAECIFERSTDIGQCSGVPCQEIMWTMVGDETTGRVWFEKKMVNVSITDVNTNSAHCDVSGWCVHGKCKKESKLGKMWKREIKHGHAEWKEDPHGVYIFDDGTATAKLAWRIIHKYDKCNGTVDMCHSPRSMMRLRVALQQCDVADEFNYDPQSVYRPVYYCRGQPIKIHSCGACPNYNSNANPEPCTNLALLNGKCLEQ